MMQLAADMFVGTEAPVGYGHEYASADYQQSWLKLTEPKGWSLKELEQLRTFFAKRDKRKTMNKDL